MVLNNIKNGILIVTRYLWSLFLHGLVTTIPIAATLSIFYFALELVKRWLQPLRHIQPEVCKVIPYSEIILAILFIFLIGSILRTFVFKSLIKGIETLLFKLPLVKPVYAGLKQLVQAFSPEGPVATFKKVVLIEFPRKGAYSLGFMTTQVPAYMAPEKDKKFYNIFVPTTPNPTTGYFVMLPESEIKHIALSRQEAMAMIISGGIIQPEQVHNTEK